MKNVVLLGSTGTIGTSTVKVAEDLPDQIRLIGLAAGNNAELLLEQTRRHQPAVISINDPAKAKELQNTARHELRGFLRQRRPAQTRHAAGGGHCADRHRRHGGLAAGAGGDSRGQGHRRGVQGNSGHGRRNRDDARRANTACACWPWTANTPRFSNASTASRRFRPQTLADRQRRAVPRQDSFGRRKNFPRSPSNAR